MRRLLRPASLAVSLSVHAFVGWLLGPIHEVSSDPQARPTTEVEYFELAPEPEPQPQPQPATAEATEKVPPVRSRAPARRIPAPTPTTTEVTRSVEPSDTPLDLTGVTLSAASGSFSLPAGDGRGASGRPRPAAAPAAKVGPERPSKRARVAWAKLSALSRPPAPPNLEGVLQSHYPPQARANGISGQASVRARITARGVARRVRVVSESEPGFGAACRATVDGSRWTPPLDAHGAPVATDITYRCHFRVIR